MRRFQVTVDIEADPAQVWAVMRDVERWSDWTASITSVRLLDAGPIAVGSRALVRQPRLPPAVWTVTSLDEGRGFVWTSTAAGLSVAGSHRVDPRTGGARVTLQIAYRGLFGGLLAWLTRGLNQRYIVMEAEGLKRWTERAASGPVVTPGARHT